MLTSAFIESVMIFLDFKPLILAISPNPQLSLKSSFLKSLGIFFLMCELYIITKNYQFSTKSVILCHTHTLKNEQQK